MHLEAQLSRMLLNLQDEYKGITGYWHCGHNSHCNLHIIIWDTPTCTLMAEDICQPDSFLSKCSRYSH